VGKQSICDRSLRRFHTIPVPSRDGLATVTSDCWRWRLWFAGDTMVYGDEDDDRISWSREVL